MFILLTAVILAIGIVFLVKSDERDWMIATGIASTIVGGVLLVTCLVGILVGPFQDRCKIAEFNETRATVEAARVNQNISAIELAAIQQKVVEMNQWLASVQYLRKNPWLGIFNAREVLDIKPIR